MAIHTRPNLFGAQLVLTLAAWNLIGAGLLTVAHRSATSEATLAGQLDDLSLAVVAVMVAVAADIGGLFSARRALVARRRLILDGLPTVADAESATTPGTDAWPWVALEVGTMAHRAACPLVAGKAPVGVEADEIRRRGLERCPVCAP